MIGVSFVFMVAVRKDSFRRTAKEGDARLRKPFVFRDLPRRIVPTVALQQLGQYLQNILLPTTPSEMAMGDSLTSRLLHRDSHHL